MKRREGAAGPAPFADLTVLEGKDGSLSEFEKVGGRVVEGKPKKPSGSSKLTAGKESKPRAAAGNTSIPPSADALWSPVS
jgi:hypothetical protein